MKPTKGFVTILVLTLTMLSTLSYGQSGDISIDTLDWGYLAYPLPPIYAISITHKGFTLGGGVAYQGIEHPLWITEYYNDVENDTGYMLDHFTSHELYRAIRPGVRITYGFTPWLAAVGRGGMLIDFDGITTPTGGIGIKLSTPWQKYACASVILEADYPHWFVATAMIGGVTVKGQELITLGVQSNLLDVAPLWDKPYYLLDRGGYVFFNAHPLKGIHLLAGIAIWPNFVSDLPGAYVSIGYTYNIAPQVKRTRIKIIVDEPLSE